MGGALLPSDRQVDPVNKGRGRGVELKLSQQGEVVGGDVGVWAAGDAVFNQPLRIQRSQDP